MQEITHRLSNWYKINKRDLPWRQTSDPYCIWLSEVILQQTRIQQGLGYYLKFTNTYPSIFDLANADIDEILKLWQGLGYYTRARNLHATAKTIVNEHNGNFPSTYAELIQLKGVGEYTAAAVASIAFKESVPVIDGNVLRVISRLFSIEDPVNSNPGKKAIKKIVAELIDKNAPGTFNQSIMEFGSLQCTPQNPDCKNCILNNFCLGLENKKIDTLPRKIKNKPQQVRHFNYLVLTNSTHILIKKRNENDIWKGLYEFPLYETEKKLTHEKLIDNDRWNKYSDSITIQKISKEYKHILSHRILKAIFIIAESDKIIIENKNEYFLIPIAEINKYAVPRLIERFLTDYKFV